VVLGVETGPRTRSETGSDTETAGVRRVQIIAIDPGPRHSGVAVFDVAAFKVDRAYCEANEDILCDLRQWRGVTLAIETMAAMGMAVGQDTFTTQLWAGRFIEAVDDRGGSIRDLKRPEIKLHLCGQTRAKDVNVRRATMDRFAPTGGGKEPRKGTKRQPGPLYGVSGNDVWSALAIAVTAADCVSAETAGDSGEHRQQFDELLQAAAEQMKNEPGNG